MIMPKSDQYLLIQNKGEAPLEGYTVLGYSSTRNCGTDNTIGQFGSGSKHAINLCLRNSLPVWVYCGKERLEFSLHNETINDGLRDDEVYHVVYRKGNGTYRRAGWVLDFGVLDWDDIGMGLREFISNAIDRTLREEGGFGSNHLSIKIVDDSDRRAKAGYTRIYVALNDEVREYYGNLGKRFLHFSDNPESAKPGLIKKDTPSKGQIYREGVWIRELHSDSVFDYNFTKDEIKIDESRNSSEYVIKAACARKLKDAKASELTQVMIAQINELDVFEASFDEDYLTDYGILDETQSDKWKQAWEAAAGPDAVVCDNEFSENFSERKGHKAQKVGSNWMHAIRRAGVTSANDILDIDEQRGRTRLEATLDALKAVEWAWSLYESANLVGDREKPEVFCFQEVSTGSTSKSGYQNHEGVHIHIDIANEGQNKELLKTAAEEVCHYITGSTDESRDFQNFLLDALVGIAT